MKGKLKEDHHTVDGALYKDDVVTIQDINQTNSTYRVETKLGKIYTIDYKIPNCQAVLLFYNQ